MNGSGDASADSKRKLRLLPKVDRILLEPALQSVIQARGRGVVLFQLRRTLDDLRQETLRNPGRVTVEDLAEAAVADRTLRELNRDADPVARILNATGVILHSGLGRAPISPKAHAAVSRLKSYGLLEVDRDAGHRRARDSRATELIRHFTGAEAALVVNNNAAATLLILQTLARGHEVICSRGELVEIGGSFRIPEVMEASGCRLVSVGATNRTHIGDYEAAITEATRALLVVHTSNYRIVGFVAQPSLEEIAALAKARGLPLIHDLGSGSLLKPTELGIGDEPPARSSIESGADVACMSGDKLLGGPQCGIIFGRKALVDRMRQHPVARALRVDKMTIAALEATLELFLDPERLSETHPVISMLRATRESLIPRARRLSEALRAVLPEDVHCSVIDLDSEAGSGALPALPLPSAGVSLTTTRKTPNQLAYELRHADPGVFVRIIHDAVCFDVRTLSDQDLMDLVHVLRRLLPS